MTSFCWKIILCGLILLTSCSAQTEYSSDQDGLSQTETTKAVATVNKLSDHVRAILEHYKSPDPVGLPGAPVPDPMPIPDMKRYFSLATLHLMNATIHGLSQFRIEQLDFDLAAMQALGGVQIEKLEVLGNYTMSTWLSRSAGGFNVTLVGVSFECLAMLDVARHGNLEATEIKMDINFNDISLDFQNLGFLGSIFQGMMNSIGTFVFDSIKPYMLKQMTARIRNGLNENIRSLKHTYPNSITPLDWAIAEGRNHVREMGYDPYKIPDYNQGSGIFQVQMTHTWVTGLASFYRVGNITLSMSNNILQVGLHIGTQRLEGKTTWELSAADLISHLGTTCFSIAYFQVEAKLNQPMDTREKPSISELQLKLGNIQLRMDGTGTMDYIFEFLINVLPNILRYQIMDAIEEPLKQKIQSILDTIDVEKAIEDQLPKLEKMISKQNETDLIDSENSELDKDTVGLTANITELDGFLF